MSWTPDCNSKRCVNCANWAGSRKEKFGSAEAPSPSERGKCYANVFCGVTPGPTASEGSSCSKFQKWSALK